MSQQHCLEATGNCVSCCFDTVAAGVEGILDAEPIMSYCRQKGRWGMAGRHARHGRLPCAKWWAVSGRHRHSTASSPTGSVDAGRSAEDDRWNEEDLYTHSHATHGAYFLARYPKPFHTVFNHFCNQYKKTCRPNGT